MRRFYYDPVSRDDDQGEYAHWARAQIEALIERARSAEDEYYYGPTDSYMRAALREYPVRSPCVSA